MRKGLSYHGRRNVGNSPAGSGTNPFFQSGPTLDLVFVGVATDPLDTASTTDDTLNLAFLSQTYQVAAQYAIWVSGSGLQAKTFADIVTFSRTGSTATYFNSAGVLTTAAADVPRFDYDPITLAAQGLLIEEQRANNFIWSDSFRARQLNVTVTSGTFQDGETVTATGGGAGTYIAADSTATSFAIYNLTNTSAWTGTLTGGTSGATATINAVVNVWSNNANTTITRNTQAAPDGTTTADTMAASTVGTFARTTFQELNTSTQGAWTFSLFVKAGTLTNNLMGLRLRDNTGTHAFRANFNLSTLAVPTVSIDGATWVAGTATVTPCPNGWVRISISGTVNTTISFLRGEIWLGGYQNVAETIGTAFLWGGQLEAGTFPTSYIPTTTSALTRGADQASVNTLSPWYNATQGTLYAHIAYSNLTSPFFHGYVGLDDSTTSNRMVIRRDGASNFNNFTVSSGFGTNFAGAIATSGNYKLALAYANNDYQAVENSVLSTAGTSGVVPVVTRMTIGFSVANSPLGGWIRRITYYPRRLANADLQTITT